MSARAGATAWNTLVFSAAAALIAIAGLRETRPPARPAAHPSATERPIASQTPPELPEGCGQAPAAPAVSTAKAHAGRDGDDLEAGRTILAHHCGSCHTPGLPTSQAGALAIFSLADADWTAHMTPKQICVSGRRLHGTSHQPDEVRLYEDLISRLLAKRGAPPCGA